jgi:uncharacterized membrane protein
MSFFEVIATGILVCLPSFITCLVVLIHINLRMNKTQRDRDAILRLYRVIQDDLSSAMKKITQIEKILERWVKDKNND